MRRFIVRSSSFEYCFSRVCVCLVFIVLGFFFGLDNIVSVRVFSFCRSEEKVFLRS